MGAFAASCCAILGWTWSRSNRPPAMRCALNLPLRKVMSHREGSLRFAYLNAGKRSITVEHRQASGRNMLLDLVERADVVVEDFAPGHLAGSGLDYENANRTEKELSFGFGERFWPGRSLRAIQDAAISSATPWAVYFTSAAIRR